MIKKRILSVLCGVTVLLTSIMGGTPMMTVSVVHAENAVMDNTQEIKELTDPNNLREEDGFIIWDEVEDAYGYSVEVSWKETDNGEDEIHSKDVVYYTNKVELKRFFYEQKMEFGEYEFKICAFDESKIKSEYSDSVTASYAPTFEAPTNVRLDENGHEILWDKVEGAKRYNVYIFKKNETNTLYNTCYTSDSNIWWKGYLGNSGNYLFSIQAMDKDYNVSEWTQPVQVSYTTTRLEAPKNVRLDESGENVLWDEVEGAAGYQIVVYSYLKDDGQERYKYYYTSQENYNNWECLAYPDSVDGKYIIYVYACSETEEINDSDFSEGLEVTFNPSHDESISVPENIRLDGEYLKWNGVEGADRYYLYVKVNGEIISGRCYRIDNNKDDNETMYGCSQYIGRSELPAGNYEAELFVFDKNNNYNSKIYPLNIDTVHDETVWVPELHYKFETLLWDYDRLRHDYTSYFWIRLKKDNKVIKLSKSWSEYFYGLTDLSDGDYIIKTCAVENWSKVGNWSNPLLLTKHREGLFDKENEVTTETESGSEAEQIPEEDRITSITINPAFNMKNKDDNNVELDLTKIRIKAKEIYDEEGLKRASEALGEKISGNKHYNLLDLTLFEGDRDISNGYEGLVQVIIPLPKGHRDKTFSCYRLTEINGKMTKEEIPGEQTEDSYIIYLEHFSEYALVADGGEEAHTHVYEEEWKSDETTHWKECECGEKTEESEHTYGDWIITKEATEAEEGSKERSCEVCGNKVMETIEKLPHVVFGDVNGDGEVDIKDSALIKRHLAGWEVDMNMAAADLDGDGNITIKDSALIKRKLVGCN